MPENQHFGNDILISVTRILTLLEADSQTLKAKPAAAPFIQPHFHLHINDAGTYLINNVSISGRYVYTNRSSASVKNTHIVTLCVIVRRI